MKFQVIWERSSGSVGNIGLFDWVQYNNILLLSQGNKGDFQKVI